MENRTETRVVLCLISQKIDKIVRKYRMAGNGYCDEYIDKKVRVRIGLEFRE